MNGNQRFYWTFLAVMSSCTVASAQFWVRQDTPPAPVAAPVAPKPPVEVTLEDPRTPDSKCYLDLDSGKVFSWGESTPDNALQSRRWRNDNGVDLMSESRFPAEGLATYDLVLVKRTEGFDVPREYEGTRKMLEKMQPDPFSLTSVGADLPATYVFRTKDGAIGVMEVEELTGAPSGVKLRYKMLDKPPPPVPPSASGWVIKAGAGQLVGQGTLVFNGQVVNNAVIMAGFAGNFVVAPQQGPPETVAAINNRIAAFEQQIAAITKSSGPNDPAITLLRMRLSQLQQEIVVAQWQLQPVDNLNELKNRRFEIEARMKEAAKLNGFDSPQVRQLRRAADDLDSRINAAAPTFRGAASDRFIAPARPGAAPPATKPAPPPLP